MHARCEAVVVDAPRLAGLADVEALAPHVDGILVVVGADGATTMELLRHAARARAENDGAPRALTAARRTGRRRAPSR